MAKKSKNTKVSFRTSGGRSVGYATNGMPHQTVNRQITKGSTSVPERMQVCLRYVQIVGLSTASTGYAENLYRINSVYDPDYSGAGAQPVGYDQWSSFYTYYRVDKLDYVFKFASATSLSESVVSVTPNLVNTIDNQGGNVLSEPLSVNTVLSTNGGWAAELSGTIHPHEIFGVPEQTYRSEESYSSATSANPTNVAYLHARVETLSGGLSGIAYYIADLMYTVTFYKRQELELSLLSLKKAMVPSTEVLHNKEKKIVLSQKELKALGVVLQQ